MDDKTGQAITHRAIKSTKWVFLSSILSKTWQPIVTIILARLLTPEDFGLLAFATIVTSVIALFQDLGQGQALIQRSDKIDDAANVVFWTNILLGIVWYICIFIIAPYVAVFFHTEKVVGILRVMGLLFVIQPLGSIQGTFMVKGLYFKELFFLTLSPMIIRGILSIALAYIGMEVWSLVYGAIAGAALNVLLLWFSSSWRPRVNYNWNVAKEMFYFGSYVSLESIMAWGITMLDNVLVGRYWGPVQLGIYNVGFNLAHWPSTNITGTLTTVLYPTFSEIQKTRDELGKIYLKIVSIVSLITFPFGAIIPLTADKFIPLLLGEKWSLAIPVIQILVIWGILSSIMGINSSLYKAIGKPDIYPKFFLIRLLVSIPVYYYSVQYGIISLCFAHLTLVSIFAPINFYIGIKVLQIRPVLMFNAMKLSALCTLLIGFLTFLIKYYLTRFEYLPDLIVISILISFFIAGYILGISLLNRRIITEVKGILRIALA